MGVWDGECDRCPRHNRGYGVSAVPFGVRCARDRDLVADHKGIAVGQRCRGGRAAARGGEWHARTVIDAQRHRSASRDGEASGLRIADAVCHACADIGRRGLVELR